MPNLFEMKKARHEISQKIEAVLFKAQEESRPLTDRDTKDLVSLRTDMKDLDDAIAKTESNNTLATMFRENGPGVLYDIGRPGPAPQETAMTIHRPKESHPLAAKHHSDFIAWARAMAGSLTPTIEASDPSGVIGVGTGTGMYPANFATPLEILPFERSYIQYAPFERAGARVIATPHMRDVNLPVLAAGAEPSQFAEGQGPATGSAGSQPFGLSGFTFKAYKKSRQVIADWESLMSTEYPLQPLIVDELLSAIANAHTHTATTALFNALTAPPNVTIPNGGLAPLQVGGSGVQADVYGQMTALRHSLVDGLEDPSNCWMLSRNTLAIIRNTRASTSGVVMFDPESDTILGRPYVTNEYFDSVCGAGFVAYGNWNKGAFLRRTPLLTRVLQELYATNNEIGFLVTQWADNHFLAELVGATNPPSHQPLYCTVLPSGVLP